MSTLKITPIKTVDELTSFSEESKSCLQKVSLAKKYLSKYSFFIASDQNHKYLVQSNRHKIVQIRPLYVMEASNGANLVCSKLQGLGFSI